MRNMAPLRLERREPAQNRLRFYNIAVTRTLFDGWAMVREMWFATGSAAIKAGAKIRQRKERYGYRAT